jgi:hypothetical protein
LIRVALLISLLALLWPHVAIAGTEPPPQQAIPIGLDAYRQWERWPEQRIGMRAYMRSTYDRTGGNRDASHFLYQLADDYNVTLDLEGPGLLVFSRFNHWHGSPWHFVIDGTDHVIQETSTADPLHPKAGSTFLPSQPFPEPLNFTWSTTKGADLIGTPMPFTRSLQIAYGRTHYGTGYYIYDRFVAGTPLSHPLTTWKKQPPPQDVLDLIAKAGSDLAPAHAARHAGKLTLRANETISLAKLSGAATVRALAFSIPRSQATAFQNARLRVTWDGRSTPSIDAPIALFYGAGTLYNRDNREYLVKAFPVNIRFDDDRIYLACYFPMPFFHSAHIELAGAARDVSDVAWSVSTVPLKRTANQEANQLSYFHATYRDFPSPVMGKDLVLLDTRGVERAPEWSGQLAGTSFIFSHEADLTTLEGDPRFFFDDSRTPQVQGTGTEEWAGGGDYWGGRNMTLPFYGHPVGAKDVKSAANAEDRIESAYRFLLADVMPFGRNAVIQLEHGGIDDSIQHYETVTYWYGLPAPSLMETDRLQIGDAASERSHGYTSPDASQPYTIESRYEWGADTVGGKQIFPAERDTGRTTWGTSSFRLRLNPKNVGVMLRRKLDYALPNQRAEIYVADLPDSAGRFAGIWYLAGSNSPVYSDPKEELGATQHVLDTSNRRFRDDEFLIPRELTRGRRSIWVRVKFTPVNRPLYPGHPPGEQAWSEMRYTAYCFVVPKFAAEFVPQ